MLYFEFQNVTIGVNAKTAKEAYTKLCNALRSIDAEYSTDTYSRTSDGVARPTTRLFPKVK